MLHHSHNKLSFAKEKLLSNMRINYTLKQSMNSFVEEADLDSQLYHNNDVQLITR